MTTVNSPASLLVDLDGNDLLDRAIEAYYEDIAAAAGRAGHSRSAALDIVHDLYVKLSGHPERLQNKRSLKAYLCQAAINLGIDRFRSQRFEATLFSGTESEALAVAADAPAPDHALEIEARIIVLREAIAELPARQRAVFVLNRLHQLPRDEIARKLRISRNMVDRHLRRAYAHCLDRLSTVEMELATWSWSR